MPVLTVLAGPNGSGKSTVLGLLIRERAARGGHFVPDGDVRRRYERSLKHLPDALRLAHSAIVYDNSAVGLRKVMETRDGVIVWRALMEPAWLTAARQAIP